MVRKKENQQPKDEFYYVGFAVPESNYFKMPNDWTNLTAKIKSIAEIKTVEYILKHTWGYQEFGIKKHITIDEFVRGRKRRDGSRIDKGTGLSERGVRYGLESAVKHGLIEEEVDDSDRGRIKKFYSLRMKNGDERDGEQNLQPGVQTLHPHLQTLPSRGAEFAPRSEKETLERNYKKETVNGSIKNLPNLNQPKEKTEYIAQYILNQLGDKRSRRFYHLVAAKVPESVIRETLAEIKADGARAPARVFTHRMNLYALKQRKKQVAAKMAA